MIDENSYIECSLAGQAAILTLSPQPNSGVYYIFRMVDMIDSTHPMLLVIHWVVNGQGHLEWQDTPEPVDEYLIKGNPTLLTSAIGVLDLLAQR